jgi:hypothetical protein
MCKNPLIESVILGRNRFHSCWVVPMPTPVRFLVMFLVSIGTGALTWGVGGLLRWEAPLIQNGQDVYMDARGAIGIGVGALAGAVTAVILFRERTGNDSKQGWKGQGDLS